MSCFPTMLTVGAITTASEQLRPGIPGLFFFLGLRMDDELVKIE